MAVALIVGVFGGVEPSAFPSADELAPAADVVLSAANLICRGSRR
jgi:hypothetical protein